MNNQEFYGDPNPYAQPPVPQKPLGWYKAYKIIALIFAILGSVGIVMSVASMIMSNAMSGVMSDVPDIGPFADGIFQSMQPIFLISLIIDIISVTLYYLVYFGLDKFKKIGLISVYIQAAWMPASVLIMMPFLKFGSLQILEFFNAVATDVPYDLISAIFSNLMLIITIFTAVIYAALFILNAVYFHKRRELFR